MTKRSGDDGAMARLSRLCAGYRVASGTKLDLSTVPTGEDRSDEVGKAEGERLLAQQVKRLDVLQERLYASGRWSVLLILQAMDAGGKDGTIKHVLSGVNPQGLTVVSFKAPGPEELAHDFLWRVHRALPARGMIGIFNRSHYEEVVVTRVHPALIDAQKLPEALVGHPDFWRDRYEDIAAFERYIARQGTRIVKVFLHVGREKQKARLRARLDEPGKLWKFDMGDLRERERWPDYMAAYGEAMGATSTEAAPWYVVPADQKWFARLAVARILVDALEALDLRTPEPSPEVLAKVDEARQALQ